MNESEIQPLRPRSLIVQAILVEGGLVVLAIVAGWWLGHSPLRQIEWNVAGLVWGTAAALPLLLAAYGLLRVPAGPLRELTQLVEEVIAPLFADCSVWVLALISILAGLGEEMLFRGVLQEAVTGWSGGEAGLWLGLIVASLLFGVAHALSGVYVVLASLIGLYLGGLWLVSDNLLAPILAHALYDFLALVYLVRIKGGAVANEKDAAVDST